MVISFKQISGSIDKTGEPEGHEWLYHEILRSLPKEVIEEAKVRQEVNVLLSIGNIIVEPILLNDLLGNISNYIDEQAEAKYQMRMDEEMDDFRSKQQEILEPLEEATKEATRKIRESFKIKEEL